MAQVDKDIEGLLDELIEREGGYANHPADRGGPTRFGITEAVARAHGYGGAMASLPRDEAAAIYRRLYWLRPRFDAVAERSPALAAELFDTGANMGPAVAATAGPMLAPVSNNSAANAGERLAISSNLGRSQ